MKVKKTQTVRISCIKKLDRIKQKTGMRKARENLNKKSIVRNAKKLFIKIKIPDDSDRFCRLAKRKGSYKQ